MDKMEEPVKNEYIRWAKIIGDVDPYDGTHTIGLRTAIRAHFLIADYFYKAQTGLGGIGPKSLHLLHSALGRQFASYGGKNKWNDPFDICATVFYGLIKNHSFHDSNKRTALLCLLYQLRKIGYTPRSQQKEFETLTVRIAGNDLDDYGKIYRDIKKGNRTDPEINFISRFLRKHTRAFDKRNYEVTYHELKSLFEKVGFTLENQHNHQIDLVRITSERSIMTFGKSVERRQRIFTINFPGWKRKAPTGTIKILRQKAGLVDDAQVFFKGADPMASLISDYQGPLDRLADK